MCRHSPYLTHTEALSYLRPSSPVDPKVWSRQVWLSLSSDHERVIKILFSSLPTFGMATESMRSEKNKTKTKNKPTNHTSEKTVDQKEREMIVGRQTWLLTQLGGTEQSVNALGPLFSAKLCKTKSRRWPDT